MADWVTISSLATAGGTLVLAVATFSSVRSANRSARTAERSLLAGVRPIRRPFVASNATCRSPPARINAWPEVRGERAEVLRYWSVDSADPR